MAKSQKKVGSDIRFANISQKNDGSVMRFADISQKNVYNISQQGSSDVGVTNIKIDEEVAHLLDWLSKQQGISREIALKKAVVTAAYIHDITANQGGKLLVQRKDNSVGEIVLK